MAAAVLRPLDLTRPAIAPGYHLDKRHWNSVTVGGSVPDEELPAQIDHSYELVVAGLTRAEKNKLV